MNLTSLTAADFKRIVNLLEQKETLQAKVAQIDATLAAYQTGQTVEPPKTKRGRKPGRPAKAPRGPGKGGRRRQLKSEIIDLVRAAGKSGITVKEVAARLGIGAQRIYVWFGATGRKVAEIKKVAPGTYAWVG